MTREKLNQRAYDRSDWVDLSIVCSPSRKT